MLVKFEAYLLGNLRASDVCKDEEGAYMYNANQVAYLVEDCKTKDQHKVTKRRMQEGIAEFQCQIRPGNVAGLEMVSHLHNQFFLN